MTNRATGRIDYLDVARGLSISLVVIDHYFGRLPADFPPLAGRILRRLSQDGWLGVDLFFVMSGYLIGTILLKNRDSDKYFSSFYARRFLRIMPLYAVTLLLFLVFRASYDWQTPRDAVFFQPYGSIWPYAAMAQNIVWAMRGQWGPGWLAVTWSLAVEEQFYLVLPALIRFVPTRILPRILLGFVVMAPMLRIVLRLASVNSLAPYLLFPCRMDALFLGVLVAWMMLNVGAGAAARVTLFCKTVAAAAGATLVLLTLFRPSYLDPTGWGMQTIGYSVIDLAMAACLYVVLQLCGTDRSVPPLVQPIRWLGLGAYPIYLFHRPVQFAVERLLHRQNTSGLMVDLVATCGLGAACWLGIERPLIAWGARRFRYTRSSASRIDRNAMTGTLDSHALDMPGKRPGPDSDRSSQPV